MKKICSAYSKAKLFHICTFDFSKVLFYGFVVTVSPLLGCDSYQISQMTSTVTMCNFIFIDIPLLKMAVKFKRTYFFFFSDIEMRHNEIDSFE